MALSPSAVSELLEVFRTDEGVNVIREAVRLVMQELIEVEAIEAMGAGRYERADSRTTGARSFAAAAACDRGRRHRAEHPQAAQGVVLPGHPRAAPPHRQALYAVVMEAYVAGVSTRSVDDLVAALGIDSGLSKSEVSRICVGLDEVVTAVEAAAPMAPLLAAVRPGLA